MEEWRYYFYIFHWLHYGRSSSFHQFDDFQILESIYSYQLYAPVSLPEAPIYHPIPFSPAKALHD